MRKELEEKVDVIRDVIAERLDKLVPADGNILTDAIRYSLLNSGKRLRPLLAIETAKLFLDEVNDDIINVAAAIEMMHTFSLIHDDLPAMDNDDYRRGEPTCHRKFKEYDAILAGDSLVFLGYEVILSKTKTIESDKKNNIILKISQALGYRGMCLGQSLDVEFEKSNRLKTLEDADRINILKTGYLFKTCIEVGCILGNADEEDTRNMIEYSLNFGKAFQLMDDLDDNEIIESDIENIKKKIILLVDNCKNILRRVKYKNKDSIRTLELIAEFCLK